MSFYGKVVNYLSNVFQSIKAGNSEVSSENGALEFKGDDSLIPQVEKKEDNVIVTYTHYSAIDTNTNEPIIPSYIPGYANDPENTDKYYLGIQVPRFDRYGHATADKISVAILSIKDDGQGNITIENPQEEANITWIGQDYYIQY